MVGHDITKRDALFSPYRYRGQLYSIIYGQATPSVIGQKSMALTPKRKELKLTQQELADKTGFNRAQLSRLEQENYYPLIPQLEALGDVLGFELDDVHHFQSGVFKRIKGFIR